MGGGVWELNQLNDIHIFALKNEDVNGRSRGNTHKKGRPL